MPDHRSLQAYPGYTLPVVRELPRRDASREQPPDRSEPRATQRELVRQSLIGCPARRR